ncbi:MAG: hypothetical protein AVDCRST_MAG93-4787, partial [uncultured Chloroflexia bacterium]
CRAMTNGNRRGAKRSRRSDSSRRLSRALFRSCWQISRLRRKACMTWNGNRHSSTSRISTRS